MNLLLILSALLSALTGASVARVPEVRLHQAAASVRAAVQVAPARAVAVRFAGAMPTLAALARCPHAADVVVPDSLPAYAMRRRE